MPSRWRPRQRWGAGLLVATLALLALVAVVAEGTPLEAPKAGERLQLDLSLMLLVVLVVLAIGVAAVVYAAWALLSERPVGRAHQARRSWLSVVIAAAVVGLLLALPERREPPPDQGAAAEDVEQPAGEQPDDGPSPPVWPVVALGVAFAVAMAGALLGGRRPRPAAPEGEPPPAPPDVEVARKAFDASLDELEAEPDARRAVITAYASLLTGLERAGVPRRRDEAPDEHLERALGALDVPSGPLRSLVALFQEARFSAHSVGPAQKAAAIDAFRAARAALGEPAVRR